MNATLFLDLHPSVALAALAFAAFASMRLLERGAYLLLLAGGYISAVLFVGWHLTTFGIVRPSGYLDARLLMPPLATHTVAALSIAVATYYLVALRLAPTRWNWEPAGTNERYVAGTLQWPALALAIFLLVANRRGTLITSLPYPFNTEGAGMDAGLDALGVLLVLLASLSAYRAAGLSSPSFTLSAAVMLFGAVIGRLLQGERGAVLGIVLAVTACFHMNSRWRWKNLFLFVALAAAYVVLQIWAEIRWNAASVGLASAMEASLRSGTTSLKDGDIGSIQLLPQSFWHLLHTVDLWDLGIRRYGAAYLKLPLQTIPDVLANLLAIERPLNEAWELTKYRLHGGGFFVLGEAYWNFGLLGMIAIPALLAAGLAGIERWYRSRVPLECIGYFGCLCFMVFGLAYGVQSLLRAIEISIAMSFLVIYASKKARFTPVEHPVHATVR